MTLDVYRIFNARSALVPQLWLWEPVFEAGTRSHLFNALSKFGMAHFNPRSVFGTIDQQDIITYPLCIPYLGVLCTVGA